MPLIEIKHRWSGTVLYSGEHETLREAVVKAVAERADLRAADLRAADLSVANLTPIRDDIWAVLSSSPAEVLGLRDAILAGRVDGTAYEGECACLVGTLANVRHCRYTEIPGLAPNPSRPAEQFFVCIRRGSTPENSQHAKLAVEWIDQWLDRMRAAFGPREEVNA